MRKWFVHLTIPIIVSLIREHRLLWPLAVSLARGLTLDELLNRLAAMTDTKFDDLLVEGSFREAFRRAIDTYDGPSNEGVAFYDAFLGGIERAME